MFPRQCALERTYDPRQTALKKNNFPIHFTIRIGTTLEKKMETVSFHLALPIWGSTRKLEAVRFQFESRRVGNMKSAQFCPTQTNIGIMLISIYLDTSAWELYSRFPARLWARCVTVIDVQRLVMLYTLRSECSLGGVNASRQGCMHPGEAECNHSRLDAPRQSQMPASYRLSLDSLPDSCTKRAETIHRWYFSVVMYNQQQSVLLCADLYL